jgi:uncharacterized membrane protein
MPKQELKQKQTQVADKNGVRGQHVEQTLTVDDSCWLPPASELSQYQAIDPNIVSFIIDTTKKEQEFRHDFDRKRLKIFNKGNKREFWINLWGMIFALFVMVLGLGLAALLIYLDKPTIGTIFGSAALLIAASIFIRRKTNDGSRK